VAALQAIGRRFVWVVLCAGLLAIALGYLGSWVPEFDVLANGRAHFAGVAVAAVLALLLRYRPVLVLSLGAFLTFAGHALLAQQNEGPPIGSIKTAAGPAPAAGANWTVLTLNTAHHHPDQDALSSYLISSQADILVLTEFGPNKIGLLHQLEQSYPYRSDCADAWDCALVMLSRHPFKAAAAVPSVETGAAPRVWMSFGEGSGQFTVVGAQLTDQLYWPRLHRLQMAELASEAHRLPGNVMVVGDFNTTPWSAAYGDFKTLSGLHAMGPFLPSYPAGSKGLPQLAIDHMFASTSVRFEQVWLGPDVMANHRPLLAKIAVPGQSLAALP
jgi:endonuclease/exonuclease/phosphatase (EEP) superfamily protein YafD